MGIVATSISVIFLIVSIKIKKTKSIKPTTIFFALWAFILFLSTLNLYNINKPSNEAYFLTILMLIFFFVGSMIGHFIKIEDSKAFTKYLNNNKDKKMKIVYVLFFALNFLSILFNIIDCVLIVKELSKGTPMWQIRNWGLEPFGSDNPILSRRSFLEDLVRSVILTPFANIVPPITAYYFVNSKNKKMKYALLINSLIMLLSSSIASGGGRLGFIYYVGCFLLAFYIFCKNKDNSKEIIKKYIKILLVFIIIAFIFVIGYTSIRSGIGNFIKETYTYFALPPTLLSEWIPEMKETSHTYGLLTTFGIHSYFFRALQTVGLDFMVPQIYNDAYQSILNAEIFRNVGYGVGNAFVTPIYYFYIDGGYPFVCIASLIFGILVSVAYKIFEKNINLRSFAIYALIIYGIFVSFMRIQTAIPAYIISFILVMLCIKKDKDNKGDKNE